MNKSFTKSKELILDKNYKITPDSDSGVILVFSEMREKLNKKTGLLEPFLFIERFFYPRISQALRYYSAKAINDAKSIKEAIERSELVFNLIEKLDKEFKQYQL